MVKVTIWVDKIGRIHRIRKATQIRRALSQLDLPIVNTITTQGQEMRCLNLLVTALGKGKGFNRECKVQLLV